LSSWDCGDFSFDVAFTDGQGEGGIAAEIIVIAEVFVAGDKAVDSLSQEFGDGMFEEFRVSVIFEALRKTFDEAASLFDFSRQKSTSTITGKIIRRKSE